MQKRNPDFVAVARRLLKERLPRAELAFVGGAMLRGQASAYSDIDIVAMVPDGGDPGFRLSIMAEGWPVELFVQNRAAQDHFMAQDKKRGMCIIADMVANGIAIPGENALAVERRRKARMIIAEGPDKLDAEKIDDMRYQLCDLLDDIAGWKHPAELYGMLGRLYHELAELYLRGQGRWAGRGKWVARAMERAFPDLVPVYEDAFRLAFERQQVQKVIDLADHMLKPFGGRLWEGYYRPIPDEVQHDLLAQEEKKEGRNPGELGRRRCPG